jgi:hypothetical protein
VVFRVVVTVGRLKKLALTVPLKQVAAGQRTLLLGLQLLMLAVVVGRLGTH